MSEPTAGAIRAAAAICHEYWHSDRDYAIMDLCCRTELVEIIDRETGAGELAGALTKLLNELDGEAFAQTGTAKAEMLFKHAIQARAALAKHAKGAT